MFWAIQKYFDLAGMDLDGISMELLGLGLLPLEASVLFTPRLRDAFSFHCPYLRGIEYKLQGLAFEETKKDEI